MMDALEKLAKVPGPAGSSLNRHCESKLLKSKRKCFVCGNDSLKFPKYTFFGLPKDESRCRDWFRFMNREDMLDASLDKLRKSKFICQIHFEKRFILDSIKRKILAFNAVPTIKPYSEHCDEARLLKLKDESVLRQMNFPSCGMVGAYQKDLNIKAERIELPIMQYNCSALTAPLTMRSEPIPEWKSTTIKEEAEYSQCSWDKYDPMNNNNLVLNNNNNNNSLPLGFDQKFEWSTQSPIFTTENLGLEFFGVGW